MVVELDEQVYPEKTLRRQIQRTDIQFKCDSVTFYKNSFHFENVCLDNRITLKLALYSTKETIESEASEEKLKAR